MSGDATFADMRGRLESVGVVVEQRGDGSMVAFRNGGEVFSFATDPPFVQWADPAVETFLRTIVAYQENAQALQQNRGRDTFMLRASLRERLEVNGLVDAARAARARVEERKHITTKELFFWHPAFGQFARVSLLRGQSHVVDLQFASPTEFLAVSYSLVLTDSIRTAAAAAPPPRSARPAPSDDAIRRDIKAGMRLILARNCDPEIDALRAAAAMAECVRRQGQGLRGTLSVYGAGDEASFILACRGLTTARHGPLWVDLRMKFGMKDFLEGEMTSHLRIFLPALRTHLRTNQLFGPPGVAVDADVEAWIAAFELLGSVWPDPGSSPEEANEALEWLWAWTLEQATAKSA